MASLDDTPPLARALSALLIGGVLVFSSAAMGDGSAEETTEPDLTPEDRDFWSFRRIDAQNPPDDGFSKWERNPIDQFIGAALKERGLSPAAEAAPRVLIRRLCMDITGLPPTEPDLQQARGMTHEQWTALVDVVLGRPGYGERWGQHWLDLARFAETDGFEHDKTRADAWKYRDWVIDAFNRDLPYNRFLKLQLAGDEAAPGDPQAEHATHFCVAGPDMPDINLLAERRHTLLNEMTATVGEVFMGLQIGCAQCHHHKYDPISQHDFYRLRAVFEPGLSLEKNKSVTVLRDQLPRKERPRLMIRGDFRRPGAELHAEVPRLLRFSRLNPKPSETSTGQRLALANWLTDPRHPLTARVIVNRVWQHHFGRGLVDSPSDFGVMGSMPANQQLLDWLAQYLIREDWSLRSLHRLILTSATWKQTSTLAADASPTVTAAWHQSLKKDPKAIFLSRYPRWRLEGEAIRDSMLSAAGLLNRQRGGPGVRPPLPRALLATLLKNQWNVTSDVSQHSRRSVYIFARRNLRYPLFEAFDRPSANVSCSGRSQTTTAPQSLFLLNSDFTLQCARATAAIVADGDGPDEQKIGAAFERILSRPPTENESHAVMDYLSRLRAVNDDQESPFTHLCLALFNTSEFLFVD